MVIGVALQTKEVEGFYVMNSKDFRSTPAGRLVRSQAGGWAFLPDPLPPQLSWGRELIFALSAADRALGELAGLARSQPNLALLARPLIYREAVFSSRLAGSQASLNDLYIFEAFQAPLLEKVSGLRAIQNYIRALAYGLGRLKNAPLSLSLLAELHVLLLEGQGGRQQLPGEFRKDRDLIRSSTGAGEAWRYAPPPALQLQQALQDFEKNLRAPPDLPPLIQLGLVHYQFAAIQPFVEGSGRIGRLLVSLLLCSWDLLPQPLLYLSAYLEAHRQAYLGHLQMVSQQGQWEEWLVYFLQGVKTQAEDAALRLRHLQELRQQYHTLFQATRAAGRLMQLIDLLFEQPVLSIQQVSMALGVQNPVAQQYVGQLKEAGILREIIGQARNRIYQADEILFAIEGSLLGSRQTGL